MRTVRGVRWAEERAKVFVVFLVQGRSAVVAHHSLGIFGQWPNQGMVVEQGRIGFLFLVAMRQLADVTKPIG